MTPTILRAGPLRMELHGPDLRYVCLGQKEVVRRLYVAVRDAHWGTVPVQLSDVQVQSHADTFEVSFTARHTQDAVDFVWQGEIAGGADGSVRYAMRGVAQSTFERARIGICVLHPIDTCAGAPFSVTHPDGSVETGELPRLIAPHQPVMDIVALSHPLGADGTVELRFEGDVFEMEDQRNWTDASFKTYSTPLRLPLPVRVERGTQINQTVSVRVRPTEGWTEPSLAPEDVVSLDASGGSPLPAIGLGLGQRQLSEPVRARLRELRLAHLRVDLLPNDAAARLRFAAEDAAAVDAPLEIALTLGNDAATQLDAVRAVVEDLQPRVARWLIFREAESSTGEQWLRLARERLGDAAPIGGGANTNFTELNRGRPPVSAMDVVCYPIMAQVHAFDDLSVMETLDGQRATVVSAQAFAAGLPLAITPITLRRPPRPGEDTRAWPADDVRSPDDPRQMTSFVAAWTVGSLAALAEAGANSLTYFEASGPRGIMAEDGTPYPVYEVFAALARFGGNTVTPTSTRQPLSVRALALAGSREGGQRVLVSNLTDQARTVRVGNVTRRLGPSGIAVVDVHDP